ncbi:MAG: RusA family crossover junction endodeoxyribonuclease [Hyphomicrobiaceae bacterium]
MDSIIETGAIKNQTGAKIGLRLQPASKLSESRCRPVTIKFYFATKHKRDLDNQNKLVLDALSGIVYDHDAQIADLRLVRRDDAARPHRS